MKQSVFRSDFIAAFHAAGRGEQFSYEALDLLFDYLEQCEQDTGEEIDLDVIALCCDYAESTPDEIAEQYDIENDDDEDEPATPEQVTAYLEDEGAYIGTTGSGSILYRQF